MDATSFARNLDAHLTSVTRRRGGLGAPLAAVRGADLDYRFGTPDLPFHAASVGKLVTTALTVGQFPDVGTRLADVLPPAALTGLFAPGAETTVTLRHLLQHTSGVADYFDGRVTSGQRTLKLLARDPQRAWTPQDLLAITRERQRPVGTPGQRFHYSDTGFVLLGLALEEATGQRFEDLVHTRVFEPLGMHRAFLPWRTQPATGSSTIAPLRLGRHEYTASPALTVDWAGGGIAATVDDWLTLSAALHDGRLLPPGTFADLTTPLHRMRPGLHYGTGVMTVRFEGFMPWLRGWPRPVGHLGVLAAHLWRFPTHGVDVVLGFGATGEMSRSFRTLFEVARLLGR
ncbi:hypothetical protein GCM10025789_03190 [Tessaracoccus lubricantis]|uniref:Beta-lactamase-related domain-containing protein n=1 Tax=Tessaracoccus lubricantis TaxID=545543 RepID=A0ABP9F1D6_9ACTN